MIELVQNFSLSIFNIAEISHFTLYIILPRKISIDNKIFMDRYFFIDIIIDILTR